ncbi:MAG: hypothetical protein R2779_11400 [Crocinitomicaceae bacterium]|nr:hypothetical protein [Crocinitomicaceae bacterium]
MNLILNNYKRAEEALNQHRVLGSKSKLSIVEVARLMDIVKKQKQTDKFQNESLFYQFGLN